MFCKSASARHDYKFIECYLDILVQDKNEFDNIKELRRDDCGACSFLLG